jgi:hypothetical protein
LAKNQHVRERDLAERLLKALCDSVGPGFHPDTEPGEYVDEAGDRVYGQFACETFDRVLDYAFMTLSGDTYDVAFQHMTEANK